jgi:RNA polymerase sigma factor (sigma-70 family)
VEVEQVMDATSGELDRRLREEEMKNVLSQALESLVPRDRLLLSLKYEDEMSGRQIAQIMGYESPFHVYRRLKVVLASLKEDLVKRGIDGSRP